jgi:hypothetical protein
VSPRARSARGREAPQDGADDGGPTPVPLLRAHPALVETVAQLLWAAAPQAQLMRDDPDDAGLVPLYLRAPLQAAESGAFERGLDALLTEARERRRGTYLREVRDLRGRRRELGVPVAPDAWSGTAVMVGPFAHEAEATAWLQRGLGPGWLGDTLPHAGAWYVDVFLGDDETLRAGAR